MAPEQLELLRQVFASTFSDEVAGAGVPPDVPPPERADVTISAEAHSVVVAAFGYVTTTEWDSSLADAIRIVVDVATTRALDFDA